MTERRPRTDEQRQCRITLRLDSAELEALNSAARRAGVTVSGYTAAAALAVARDTVPPEPTVSPREIVTQEALTAVNTTRAQLVRVGVLFNQAVAKLNATGVEPDGLRPLAAMAARAVDAVDAAISDLSRRRR